MPNLGAVLAGEVPQQESIRPTNSPLAQAVGGDQQGKQRRTIKDLYSDPKLGPFLMQTAIGLLSSSGLGPSLGAGLSAAGRNQQRLAEQATAAEQTARDRMESDRNFALKAAAAKRAASRGTGSKGAARAASYKTKDYTKRVGELEKWLIAQAKTDAENSSLGLTDTPRPELDPTSIKAIADAVALAESMGDNETTAKIWELYKDDPAGLVSKLTGQ